MATRVSLVGFGYHQKNRFQLFVGWQPPRVRIVVASI